MKTRLLQLAAGACLILLASQALGAKPGFLNPVPPKAYYLTPGEFLGSEVEGACADGYHFASLLEIRDLANMRYDFQLGLTWEDSGSGIPSYRDGWIRADGVGPNCENWSASEGHLGPVAVLAPHEFYSFESPPPPPGGDGWEFHPHECWLAVPVWCVSD